MSIFYNFSDCPTPDPNWQFVANNDTPTMSSTTYIHIQNKQDQVIT